MFPQLQQGEMEGIKRRQLKNNSRLIGDIVPGKNRGGKKSGGTASGSGSLDASGGGSPSAPSDSNGGITQKQVRFSAFHAHPK